MASTPDSDQGRPLTPEEDRRAQSARVQRDDALRALTLADATITQLIVDLHDVDETTLARLLGVDRRTLRRWKSRASRTSQTRRITPQ